MLRCCCYATAGNIGRNKNEKNKQLKNEQTDFHFAYEVRLGIKLTTLHYELKQSGQAARRWACRTGTCDSVPGSADARLGHPALAVTQTQSRSPWGKNHVRLTLPARGRVRNAGRCLNLGQPVSESARDSITDDNPKHDQANPT